MSKHRDSKGRIAWLGLVIVFSTAVSARSATASAPPARAKLCGAEHGERVVETELAGVPAILRIPSKPSKPPIVLWHGFGPPASEQALMQAFPLDDVPAIKVYLGLPMFGKRAPKGGTDELVRRQRDDVGLLVFQPVVVGAADELPRVIQALEQQQCMRAGDRIGLFGFSAGGASALLALARREVPIGAAVLLNPSTGLTASVQAYEHATGQPYAWTPQSRGLAKRSDAVGHVAEIVAGTPPPAILLVRGDKDDVISASSVSALKEALESRYALAHESDRFRYSQLDELPHNLAGLAASDTLQQQVAAWFKTEKGT